MRTLPSLRSKMPRGAQSADERLDDERLQRVRAGGQELAGEEVGVAIDDQAGKPSPSPFTSRSASVPRDERAELAARRAMPLAHERRRRSDAAPRVIMRTAMLVAGFQVPKPSTRPSAARTSATAARARPRPRSHAIAPEKIHGCPARTEKSRPGFSVTRIAPSASRSARAGTPAPALAALLAEQAERGDLDVAIDGLAHVVDGERGDGSRR